MWKLHTLTKREFTEFARSLLKDCPVAQWDELTEGQYVVTKDLHPVRIVRVPPKRVAITVESIVNGDQWKLRRCDHKDGIKLATMDLWSLPRKSHEEVIQAAIDRGDDIPVPVQYEYPLLFTLKPDDVDAKVAAELWSRLHEMEAFDRHREGDHFVLESLHNCAQATLRSIQDYADAVVNIDNGTADIRPEYRAKCRAEYVALADKDRAKLRAVAYLQKHVTSTIGEPQCV